MMELFYNVVKSHGKHFTVSDNRNGKQSTCKFNVFVYCQTTTRLMNSEIGRSVFFSNLILNLSVVCTLKPTKFNMIVCKVVVLLMTVKHFHCLIHTKYTFNGKSVQLDVNDIVSQLKLRGSVCLYCDVESKDLLHATPKVFNRLSIPVTIQEENASLAKHCTNILLFVNTLNNVCGTFSKTKQVYLTSYFNLIIFTSKVNVSLRKVENCANVFDSANVYLISLSSGQIYILSSPYLEKRHFVAFSSDFIDDVKDLQGQLIRVATLHNPPFTIMQNDSFSGLEVNIWKVVASYLNLTWTLVKLEGTSQWGELLENGTARGGIHGALQDSAAEVSFSNIWHRRQYLAFADFGPTNSQISLTFLVRRSHKLNKWALLFKEFPWGLWFVNTVLWHIVAFMYWALNRFATPPATPSLVKSVFLIFGLLINSPQVIKSTTQPLRCLTVSWSYFSFLTTSLLVTQGMSLFTLTLNSPQVDSVQQLVKQNYYWTDRDYFITRPLNKDFYFLLDNSWQNLFEKRYTYKTPDEVRQYLEDDLANLISDDDNMAFRAQVWGEVFLLLDIQGVTNETDLSNYRVMRQSLRKFYTSFLFRKNFRLNELFSRTILKLQDHGLLAYWRKKPNFAISRKRLAMVQDENVFNGLEYVTLSSIYPVLVILTVLWMFLILVFCIELCYSKFF